RNRSARFATVVALVLGEKEYLFKGEVEGTISTEPHGKGGFGYDPIFIPIESGVAFAEMTPEEKNAISHRGRAMRKFIDFLIKQDI
ncbi:MAG: non-canonical purine NTP pyrophosphatase, partial [Muribaculaceae bacterium]|nr:non-canonical purine NTP pyrophosphatase [Muribaculaceae bacterium]